MTDDEQLDRYRRMTPSQRWEIWLELTRFADALWDANLSQEEQARRWGIWRAEHSASDRNMLEGFRRAK
ncbi:MAG: hypothetical protein HY720_08455 [Planctomycetes bacterium]|nr:hypothetical protein [Planctomycetota bacterium]